MSSVRPRKTAFKLFFPIWFSFISSFFCLCLFQVLYILFCFFFLSFSSFSLHFLTLFRSHINCYFFFYSFSFQFPFLNFYSFFHPSPSSIFLFIFLFFTLFSRLNIFSLSPFPRLFHGMLPSLRAVFWMTSWLRGWHSDWLSGCVCLIPCLSVCKT